MYNKCATLTKNSAVDFLWQNSPHAAQHAQLATTVARHAHQLPRVLCGFLEAIERQHRFIELLFLILQLLSQLLVPSIAQILHEMH